MRILGLSAFARDSAAALVVDGQLVAAAQEDRFSRTKGDSGFPTRAIRSCLRTGGLQASDLDGVVFYEKPLRKFERVLATQLGAFPHSARTFSRTLFLWLGDRLWLKNRIASELGVPPQKILFLEHHLSHAASAYLPSPFEEAAILTIDSEGEWATTTFGRGHGSELELTGEIQFPNSLGLFAAAITQFLGFEPNADELKVMELAAFGTPRFAGELESLLRPASDGSFDIDLSAFRFAFDSELTFGPGLAQRLGPPRIPGSPLRMNGADSRDADLAASLQDLLERSVLALARNLRERVPSENLCLAGSVAWNARCNARLLREGPFKRIFVQPAAGEAGGALGAALYAHQALAKGSPRWRQTHTFLGEPLGDVTEDLSSVSARALAGPDGGARELAGILARGKALGVVRDRFEWGPRSLGNRSLLADPRSSAASETIRRAIKRREPFRSFSPAVTAERAAEFFDLPPGSEDLTRFMLATVAARPKARESAPLALHTDGTARVHVVHREENPAFHALLTAFGEETGAPILLSTSLNLRGEPMVRGAADALAVFDRTPLDALVVGESLLER
jgi:carbamoyltransferase